MLAESRLLTPHSPVEKLTYNTLPQILPDWDSLLLIWQWHHISSSQESQPHLKYHKICQVTWLHSELNINYNCIIISRERKRENSTVMNFCNYRLFALFWLDLQADHNEFFKGQSAEVGCKELCQLNWHHKRLLYLLIFREGHATQLSLHFASWAFQKEVGHRYFSSTLESAAVFLHDSLFDDQMLPWN